MKWSLHGPNTRDTILSILEVFSFIKYVNEVLVSSRSDT